MGVDSPAPQLRRRAVACMSGVERDVQREPRHVLAGDASPRARKRMVCGGRSNPCRSAGQASSASTKCGACRWAVLSHVLAGDASPRARKRMVCGGRSNPRRSAGQASSASTKCEHEVCSVTSDGAKSRACRGRQSAGAQAHGVRRAQQPAPERRTGVQREHDV